MKNEVLNHKKTKYGFLILFIFLSLKYYLFSDFFTAEIPWFGLDTNFSSVKSAATFLLSVAHLILCTALLLKISSIFSENRLYLFFLVTEPFYLTSFYSGRTLLIAVLFELSLLLFSKERSVLNTALLSVTCIATPFFLFENSFGFIPFVLLVYYFLTEKILSYKKAKTTLFFSVTATAIGYILSSVIRKTPQIVNLLSSWAFDYIPSPLKESPAYKKICLVILVALNAAFWISQAVTCIKLYQETKEAKKINTATKSKKVKKKTADTTEPNHFLIDFILGLIACIAPLITLMLSNVNVFPTIMLSVITCMLIFNFKAPNKINSVISSSSLVLAIIVIIVNSLITKELFNSSEIIGIINGFAPM